MSSLQVTKDWTTFFRDNRMELVNNRIFEIRFEKKMEGNCLTYSTIFDSIKKFKNTFSWLIIKEITLQYSEELSELGLISYKEEVGKTIEAWCTEINGRFGFVTPPVFLDFFKTHSIFIIIN